PGRVRAGRRAPRGEPRAPAQHDRDRGRPARRRRRAARGLRRPEPPAHDPAAAHGARRERLRPGGRADGVPPSLARPHQGFCSASTARRRAEARPLIPVPSLAGMRAFLVMAALLVVGCSEPEADRGRERDGGGASRDAGVETDAGAGEPDAAAPERDAGATIPDAGPRDASEGTPSPDAGPLDAGPVDPLAGAG